MKFILFIVLSIYSEAAPTSPTRRPTRSPTPKPTSAYQTYNVKYNLSDVDFFDIIENQAGTGGEYDEFYSEFTDDVEEAIGDTAGALYSTDHPVQCVTQDYILDKPNDNITVDVDINYYWRDKTAINNNQRSIGGNTGNSFPAKMQVLLRDRYNSTTLIFSVDYDSIVVDAANTLSIICTLIAVCVAIFGTF